MRVPKEKSGRKKKSSNGLNVLDFNGSKKKKSNHPLSDIEKPKKKKKVKKPKPLVDDDGFLVDENGIWLLDKNGKFSKPPPSDDEDDSSVDYSDA